MTQQSALFSSSISEKTEDEDTDSEDIANLVPLRMHPRVFAALGKDLVTNDVVAVMELVKNAYDAFAENVWIEFGPDDDEVTWLQVRDDGVGMNRDVIENVWSVVATPFRDNNQFVVKGSRRRRVVGAKGLGRLSVARLGKRLSMLTQSEGYECLKVSADWSEIAGQDEMDQSVITCKEYAGESPFDRSGTSLKIIDLEQEWDSDRIDDLRENLARLLSPFRQADDFNVFLSVSDGERAENVRVESSPFLSEPKYTLRGSADALGNLVADYRYSPIIGEGESRKENLKWTWHNVRESIPRSQRHRYPEESARCGPFTFEIRAWDIGSADTKEISDRFAIQRRLVRRAIGAHKGISVYRDGVLVLPKSDNSRDWLGLDLRRVGRVGTRMSTSQLVGYVAITAEHNPGLEDTSDREGLSSSGEVADFEVLLRATVFMLENERETDRTAKTVEIPMEDLFTGLSADGLLTDVNELAREGASASDAIPLIRTFSHSLDQTRRTIQQRFVYYSRLATVGTIAQMLVHEIRNQTTTFGSILRFTKETFGPFKDMRTRRRFQRAQNAVNTLEHLADTFAPLARRNFVRRRQHLIMEDQIRECIAMNQSSIRAKGIRISVPETKTVVPADPAELDTIIVNLLTNSVHWLGEVPKEDRFIEFDVEVEESRGKSRVFVSVHDSGPGIEADDLERVFLPGVTRKPNGIGMGLNVASELVTAYGGDMKAVRPPTKRGGATFTFDLPHLGSPEGNAC